MVNIKEQIQNAAKKAGEKKTAIILCILIGLLAIDAIFSLVTSIINL